MEEEQPLQETQESFGIEGKQTDDGPHLDARNEHDKEVRSDRLNLDLACGTFRKGLGIFKKFPSQTERGKPSSKDTKVTTTGVIKSVGETSGKTYP